MTYDELSNGQRIISNICDDYILRRKCMKAQDVLYDTSIKWWLKNIDDLFINDENMSIVDQFNTQFKINDHFNITNIVYMKTSIAARCNCGSWGDKLSSRHAYHSIYSAESRTKIAFFRRVDLTKIF